MRNILLAIISITLFGCNKGDVESNTGGQYWLTEIEGCEFYIGSNKMSKVDCNCVADTTGRKQGIKVEQVAPPSR